MSLFSLAKHDGYVIVELPEVFFKEAIKEFDEASESWIHEGHHCVVFDFTNCLRFHPSGFPIVARYKMTLKKLGMSLFSINVSKEIKATIHQGGVEGIFSVCDTFKQIQDQIGFKAKVRNIHEAESLNLLLNGIQHSYKMVFNAEPTRGKPFLKKAVLNPGLGVLSVVNLNESNNLLGVVRCYFPETFMQQLQVDKYQKDSKGISQKAVDDIESLSGSYFDKIQTTMTEVGYKLQNTFPSVLIGILSQLAPLSKEISIVMPFSTKYGDFFVEVARL